MLGISLNYGQLTPYFRTHPCILYELWESVGSVTEKVFFGPLEIAWR